MAVLREKKETKVKDDKFVFDGIVTDVLSDGKFRVTINVSGVEHKLFCYESGKMRMNYIKLIIGDRVRLEVSKYDLTKGRIIYRY
jgi:translation initiation factor IF-1